MKVKSAQKTERQEQAFAAHAAMVKAENATPSLRHNPFWIMLRQDAYERFAISIEEGC